MKKTILYLHDASLSYGKNTDAHDICFSLSKGEIVSLYGLGTAGHHALADFLSGGCSLISGTVILNGRTPDDAVRIYPSESGFCRFEPFTPQEHALSVLEYLFLIRSEKYISRFWNEKKLMHRARELLDTVRLQCPVHTQLGKLTAAEYFQLQCAKAVDMHVSAVIFSEDVSGFPEEDIGKFRKTLSVLKSNDISAVICSDTLPEESGRSDRIYLFRDGTIVKKLAPEQYDREKALVYVRSADAAQKEKVPEKKTPFFSVSGLAGTGTEEILPGFSVCRAEAVNLVNYSFTSRENIFKSLTGQTYAPALKMQIGTESIRPVGYELLFKRKVAAVRNFSDEKGGFPKLSVADNMVMPSLKKICRAGFFVTDKAGKALYRQIRKQYPELPERMADCSPSERIIVRMESLIVFGPEVLIMLDPFFLLDAKCRTVVRNYIRKFIKRGTAVILISSGGSAYTAVCSRIIQTEQGENVWK